MPKYIMLSNLTDEGRKTVKMRPERIKEVNDEIEKMGAKVIEQYAVLGEYDFINILDAPDNETISRIYPSSSLLFSMGHGRARDLTLRVGYCSRWHF